MTRISSKIKNVFVYVVLPLIMVYCATVGFQDLRNMVLFNRLKCIFVVALASILLVAWKKRVLLTFLPLAFTAFIIANIYYTFPFSVGRSMAEMRLPALRVFAILSWELIQLCVITILTVIAYCLLKKRGITQ